MDADWLSYINGIMQSAHSRGYVSYTDIFEYFDNISIEKAKHQLIAFSETYGESYQKLYDVNWISKLTGQYVKKMLDEEECLNFLSNPGSFEVVDVELHMIARSNTEFCNYLNFREGLDLLTALKGNEHTERKLLHSSAHKTEYNDQTTSQTVNQNGNKNAANSSIYRKWGIAGTDNKADRYFKKSEANERPAPPKVVPKPVVPKEFAKAQEIKSETNTELIGKKRKINEIEQKLETSLVINEVNKRSKIVNEFKVDNNELKFDPKLYSMEESSEEMPIVETKPIVIKETKAKGKKKQVQQIDDMEVENQSEEQNISPNTRPQNVEVDIKKGPRKVTRKVKKWRVTVDEDGFECKSEYSSYEEYEVEESNVNHSKEKAQIESKASIYRQPEKNQKTLSSYFIKGGH